MLYKKPLSGRNKILLALLAVAVFISGVLTLFVTSPAFVKTVAVYAGKLTGMRIEIGSITLEERRRVVIEHLSVEREKDRFHLAVPYAEINFTAGGLLSKNLEGLTLRNPELLVTLKKDAQGRTSLPFTFNSLSVTGADVTLHYEDSEPLHISPVNLTLIKQTDGTYGALQGKAFISGLNTTVSLESEIDIKTFGFEKIHIDVSPIDLANAASKYPLSLLKITQLKGTCGLTMEMERARTDKENKMSWHASAALDGLAVHAGPVRIELRDRPLRLSAKGTYIQQSGSASIDSFAAELAELNLIKLHGTITHMRSGSPDLSITANVNNIPFQRIKTILHSSMPHWLAKSDTDGTVSGDMTVSGSYTVPQIQGVLAVQGKRLSLGNTVLKSFSVSLPFEYQGKSLLIKKALIQAGAISYDNMDIKAGNRFKIQDLKLDIPYLSYKNSRLLAEHVQLHAGSAAVYRDGKEYFAENNILIKGGMEGDIAGHLFKAKNLLIDAGLFKGLAGSADILTGEPVTINADLNYNSVALDEVSQKYLHGFFTMNRYTVAGTGALSMTGKMVIPESGASRISGITSVDLTDAGLSSADGSVTCEGIRMKASARFEYPLPEGPVSFSAEAGAGGFELLAGKFYGSFKDRPLTLSASGTYAGKSNTLSITKAKAALPNIGEIILSGTLSDISKAPYFDASVHAADISNSETYDFFVRETFQAQFPILARLNVSGRSSVDLDIKGTKESFTVNGDARVEDLHISDGTKDNYLSGVQVSMPVNIEYPEPLHERKAERFGSIVIKGVSWSAFKLNNIMISPSLWQNRLVFKDDISLPLFGGEVVLKDISYGSIFGNRKQLLLSVDIKGLDLEKTSVALALPKFSGNLSGYIPKARLSDNTFFTEGEMVLQLFGGTMKINDLSADKVFSPVPSLKAGIEFGEIDLGRLTSTFDFGHISGVIRGKISELVIVNGQAEHFRASLETYKKKGVEQKISVDALKKISILGTGTSTSILDRGIYQLFKEYGYEKIGFSADLKNDKLLLLGIDDGEDRRYLVKGSLLPPKVNVINFNRNISFKEMTGRLKRITAAEK